MPTAVNTMCDFPPMDNHQAVKAEAFFNGGRSFAQKWNFRPLPYWGVLREGRGQRLFEWPCSAEAKTEAGEGELTDVGTHSKLEVKLSYCDATVTIKMLQLDGRRC